MSPPVVAELRAAGCVFAEDEARLLVAAAGSAAELGRMVEQRVSGVPLEHILGWVEFCGLPIMVTPGVFVPRQRTEFLVREAVAVARPGAVVLDLCCGSGAIRLAIATAAVALTRLPPARRDKFGSGGGSRLRVRLRSAGRSGGGLARAVRHS